MVGSKDVPTPRYSLKKKSTANRKKEYIGKPSFNDLRQCSNNGSLQKEISN
jgi:hypothetical protein